MEALLFAVIALARLVEGGAAIALGWAFKRWVVILWGVLTLLLVIPVAALAMGHEIPQAATLSVSAVHMLAGASVIAATLSSRGAVRRLLEIIDRAGFQTSEGGWRP